MRIKKRLQVQMSDSEDDDLFTDLGIPSDLNVSENLRLFVNDSKEFSESKTIINTWSPPKCSGICTHCGSVLSDVPVRKVQFASVGELAPNSVS